MKLPPYLRIQGDGVVIAIKAQPRARTTEVAGLHGDELKVRIAASPVDSAANEALVEFLAGRLGCPRRSVSLLRGETSTHKQVLVTTMTAEAIAQRLV